MNQPRHAHLSGLYAITDTATKGPEKTVRCVKAALNGGAKIIQYRDKSSNQSQRLETCLVIRKLTRQNNALFIVNDDIELTKMADADGVHLGQEDEELVYARQYLGQDSLIGVSCYNRFDLALQAESLAADYVAFGSFYSSRTKPDAVKADIQLLQRAQKELTIPVVAIGGITLDNGQTLIKAGADMLAVIKGIFDQPDIEVTARQFSSLFEK